MKYRIIGILLSVLLVSGCIAAAAASLSAFADPGDVVSETEPAEETEKKLCTEIELDNTVYTVSISELDGQLKDTYLADELSIADAESKELLQDYYHIYDREDFDSLTVSLFIEDGFVTECVENSDAEFITLYRIGGADEDYRVLETESVSFENESRMAEIRFLQEFFAPAEDVVNPGEIVSEEDTGETPDELADDEEAENEIGDGTSDDSEEADAEEDDASETDPKDNTDEVLPDEEDPSDPENPDESSADSEEPSDEETVPADTTAAPETEDGSPAEESTENPESKNNTDPADVISEE